MLSGLKGLATWFSWFRLILALLIAGILSQNIILHLKNRSLQRDILQAAMREIKPGEVFSGLAGIDLRERYVNVDFGASEKGVVLISLSAKCPGCLANVDKWIKLAKSLKLSEWQVIWLSRDPIHIAKEFCAEAGIRGQVLCELSHRNYTMTGLGMVPRTMIVNPAGEVERVWVGKLDDKAWSDVFGHLNLEAAQFGRQTPGQQVTHQHGRERWWERFDSASGLQ
jgi:peroxiredoxin